MTIIDIVIKRIVLIIVVSLVIFSALAIKVLYFPEYEAEAVLMVDIKEGPTSVESAKLGMEQVIGLVRLHTNLIQSVPVLKSVVEKLKLYEDLSLWKGVRPIRPDAPFAVKDKVIRQVIDTLRKQAVTIGSPPLTNIIEVKVKHKNPEMAASIANAISENYVEWNLDFRQKEANRVLEYLSNEIGISKEKLQSSEQALEIFKKENKVVSLPEAVRTYYQVIQAMQIKVMELGSELIKLKELYTDDSPQVIFMNKRIEQLKAELDEEIKRSESGENKTGEFANIPEKEMMLARLTRDVRINETAYRFLMQEEERARLLKVKETTEEIKIISPATAPLKPRARLAKLFASAVLSFFLSLVLALGLELRGQSR